MAVDAGVDGGAHGTDNPHDGLLMELKPQVEKTGDETDILQYSPEHDELYFDC